MSFDARTLYGLLPAIHRVRDAEQGYPLRQLIEVIAGQAEVTEEHLAQLYENHFVETADAWALPYIGDLLGIRGLSGRGTLTRAPRAEVGHTIAYRRRKGTAAMLELLARDTTGWPAHAVEYFERLSTTQHVNHIRLRRAATLSLRSAGDLEAFATPFETGTRTVEVRRIEPALGKWNIPNVALFVWRLRAYALTRCPLTPAATIADGRHFHVHPLGIDLQLFTRPETEDDFTHLADPLNVPMPITRRRLAGARYERAPDDPVVPAQFHPSIAYYGDGRSLQLVNDDKDRTPIEVTELVVADLSDVRDGGGNVVSWAHEALGVSEGKALLDPTLGRIVFPDVPPGRVLATYHYGFSANMGGGEYNRARSFGVPGRPSVQVANTDASKHQTVSAALANIGNAGIVEIVDSSRYVEGLPQIDATNGQIEIRAADQCRPTVLPAGEVVIDGTANGSVVLNGLFIAGGPVRVRGELARLRLRHCTIVPPLVVGADGQPSLSAAAALIVESRNTIVEIEDCIVGSIRVGDDVTVHMKGSIIDAASRTNVALSNLAADGPAGTWRIENCTIRGKVSVSILELASNTVFFGARDAADDVAKWPAALVVQRRQEGCVRFSWLPARARVPRRHQCLPADGSVDVRPTFTSFRFGSAAYAQLHRSCPTAITTGADDESEIGVFHDLFQPQRIGHLRARLGEYLRFGLEAGIFTAT